MAKVIDILTDISYLLGEDSVPTTGIDSRIGFINGCVRDIVARYRWTWNEGQSDLALTNGVADLPADYRHNGVLFVRDASGKAYEQIDESYKERASASQFWVTGNLTDGYKVSVNNDTITAINVKYEREAPKFTGASDVTDFNIPNTMVVARGALIDIRRSENPFADVAPETQEYENDVRKLFRLERQSKPRHRQITSKAHTYGPTI